MVFVLKVTFVLAEEAYKWKQDHIEFCNLRILVPEKSSGNLNFQGLEPDWLLVLPF